MSVTFWRTCCRTTGPVGGGRAGALHVVFAGRVSRPKSDRTGPDASRAGSGDASTVASAGGSSELALGSDGSSPHAPSAPAITIETTITIRQRLRAFTTTA